LTGLKHSFFILVNKKKLQNHVNLSISNHSLSRYFSGVQTFLYLPFMDITQELLKENSRSQAEKIARYVGDDSTRLEELLTYFLKGDVRQTRRSAWAMTICCDNHPKLIKPHLKKLINHLTRTNLHDGVIRNTLRILQFQEIPRTLQGKTINLCFGYLLDKKQAVAIKVLAMSILGNLVKEHPELKNELKIAIEDQLPYESAAFVSRGKKVLSRLNHDSQD